MVSLLDIRRFFVGGILLNEPMKNYTSLRIGGPADYVFTPASQEDLIRLITYLRQNAFPFIFAGRGSNLLVSSHGYHGAVILVEAGLSGIRMLSQSERETLVRAGAGARIGRLVDFCLQHSLEGMETLAGLPATVGGMLVGGLADSATVLTGRLAAVEVLQASGVTTVTESPERFAYRRSGIGRDVVLNATFRLRPGYKEHLLRARRESLVRRNAEQPLNVPSAARMFRNPQEAGAALLVEQAGMKGYRRGAAAVWERNANVVINTGNAAAMDALALVKDVQRAVREKTGVDLELDLRVVGFESSAMREVA